MKVRKRAKIRNRLIKPTPDPGYQLESDTFTIDITNESQEVSPFQAGDHKASINRRARKHNKNKTEKCYLNVTGVQFYRHLNRNLTQFRPSEIHCQSDPTGRNCSLRLVTTKICGDRLEKQPKKAGFSSGQT